MKLRTDVSMVDGYALLDARAPTVQLRARVEGEGGRVLECRSPVLRYNAAEVSELQRYVSDVMRMVAMASFASQDAEQARYEKEFTNVLQRTVSGNNDVNGRLYRQYKEWVLHNVLVEYEQWDTPLSCTYKFGSMDTQMTDRAPRDLRFVNAIPDTPRLDTALAMVMQAFMSGSPDDCTIWDEGCIQLEESRLAHFLYGAYRRNDLRERSRLSGPSDTVLRRENLRPLTMPQPAQTTVEALANRLFTDPTRT